MKRGPNKKSSQREELTPGLTQRQRELLNGVIDRVGGLRFRAEDLLLPLLPDPDALARAGSDGVPAAVPRRPKKAKTSDEEAAMHAPLRQHSDPDDLQVRLGSRLEGEFVGALTFFDRQRVRLGSHVIRRGQHVCSFRLGKGRLRSGGGKVVGEISFHYPGNEFAVIQSAVEPIKRVISKLVVRGQFCVSDELLVELTGAFPYLDTLKLLPEGGHCTVRGPGLGTMVQRLQHLRVLYLGGCATLETLYLDAPSLERLALRRVAALRELRLQAPQIRNLVMDKCPDRPLMNPIHGLAQALAGCSQLEWLFLGGVLTTEAEVASLPLSRFRQLKGLELRVPFVGIELSIAVIGSLQWKNLSTLCLEMALSDELLAIIAQQGTQLEDVDLCAAPLSALSNGAVTEMLFSLHRLTRFALHDADTLTKLSVVSPSLQHLQVINCLDVQEVTFDCPQLMTLELRGCDKLAGRVHFVTEYRPASIVMGEGADAHVVAALAGRPLIKREK